MKRLFEPFEIREVILRNRLAIPPLANNRAGENGEVTDELVLHYRERSADVGLVVVEHSFIVPEGRYTTRQLGIHDDSLLDGLSRLASAIRAQGAAASIQITHAGSRGCSDVLRAPSPVVHPRGASRVPEELSVSEMKGLIELFVAAARRAERAGFDLVEIHGAHGYLLSQFLSPITNKRQDGYGGKLENRLRFPMEVVEAVKRAVGIPLMYRLGAEDGIEGGISLHDVPRIAPLLREAGVDLLDISGGLMGWEMVNERPGFFVPYAEAARRSSGLPCMVTGNIHDPALADAIIREDRADIVGVGRPFLKDPEWARKARASLMQ